MTLMRPGIVGVSSFGRVNFGKGKDTLSETIKIKKI